MHEIPTATLHFDPPLPGLVGGSLLQGWLVPKPGFHYTDLRVVAGAKIFPGIHGLPRRDLAEFFKSDQPYLLAGFSITLTLPAGRHRLALEGCTVAGRWEPLEVVERDVTAAEAQPDPEARAPLDAASFGLALQVLLRRLADRGLSPAAGAAAIVAETTSRHHLQHPPRPFHGHLDQPHVWCHSLFGRMPLTGWFFHAGQPIKRVFATTDLLAVQDMKYGRETPFLATRPFACAFSTHCGYDGFLDVPAQLPQPVTVRVYAELDDGTWHLGSVARFTATDQEFAKQPFAPFSRLTFWRARRALATAVRARGWTVPAGADFAQALRTAWDEYAGLAPRRKTVRPVRPTRPAASTGAAPSVHLVTHNLSHEGAPLFLLELARHLQAEAGVRLAVTSGRDGPLRDEFASLGAAVRVVDAAPVLASPDVARLRSALRALAPSVDFAGAGLVIANTVSSYWGVHLARQAGRPSLLYIHESTPPRTFFHRKIAAGALGLVDDAFRLADRVSFLTATTRRYYDDLSDGSNYCLNPGWINLAGIDAFRQEHPRAQLRAGLNVAPGRRLVINVGTICERKGQHVFARAVDLLWRLVPDLAATADFLMVGGRDTPYDRDLAAFVARLARPNLRIVGETAKVYPYYGAADLFVCSSYEESFPRVVLEAMAFALPIVATAVHGIPEMVRDGQEALLVPPGDPAAMAAALRLHLAEPEAARTQAQAARARVAAEFDSRRLLPRHGRPVLSLLGRNPA